MTGQPVEGLNDWLRAGRIISGSIFRKVDRRGNVSPRALKSSLINTIVKQRAEMAGLEPADYSAHGLRSGYLTEAANRGIPLPEAMERSRHRSVQQQRATITMRQGAPAGPRGFFNVSRE